MRTPSIDFVGQTRRWVLISTVLIAISLGGLLVRGLDLSLEFVGGTSFQLIDVRADVTAQDLRDAVEDLGVTDVVTQLQLDGDTASGAIVRTEAFEPGSEQAVAIEAALTEVAQPGEVTVSFVGPTWGQRITRQMLEALLVFLVVVMIYISLRLEFKMAVAAIVALVHDVLITIGLYALIGFSVSPATVIALLTILGYSLYDTVVVFDRVKDNAVTLGDPGRRTYPELVNSSMNEVVYRSLNTSITSLLPVGALLLIGAQVLGATTLQDLALALFLGVAVGIYSSLFVAGPFLAWWKAKEPEEARRIRKIARLDAGHHDDEEPEPVRDAPAAGSPEARAPITTDYVRGQGKGKKRRKR